MSYLTDYKEINRGYVAFGGNPKRGKITGKGTKACDNACQAKKEKEPVKDYILLPLWTADLPFSQNPKSSQDDGFQPLNDCEKKVDEDPSKGSKCRDQKQEDNVKNTNNVNATSKNRVNAISENISNELLFDPNMPALEDINTFNFSSDHEDDNEEVDMNNIDITIQVSPYLTTRIHKDHPLDQVIRDPHSTTQTRNMSKNLEEHGFVIYALKDPSWIEAMQEELLQSKLKEVWTLVDLPNGKRATGTKWVFSNKKDERGIMIRNKARLVAQGHTQEEGIDYDEVFSPVARIKTIRLFLAYASFKDFVVYQMDVKSGFLYEKIEEEVYVCQPQDLKIQTFPIKCTKLKKHYMDYIKLLEHGLQVKRKQDGIFINQDKYVTEILKKYGFAEVKNASTPMETQKPLIKEEDGEEVDVYMYRSMIGSLMYLTSSRPDIMFVVCACARYQVNTKDEGLGFLWGFVAGIVGCRGEKAKRKDTRVPYLSGLTESVVDETVYKEMYDSLVRAATTACSLKVKQDNGAKKPWGILLLRLALEIDSLKRRVKKLEKKQRSRNHKLKRLYKVGLTAKVESLDDKQSLVEDAHKQGRISNLDANEGISLVSTHDDAEMFDADKYLHGEEVFVTKQDENVVKKEVDAAQVQVSTAETTTTILIDKVTLAQVLAGLKHTKPKAKAKGIVFHKPEDSTTTTSIIPKPQSHDKAKFNKEEQRLARESTQKEQEVNSALIEKWNDIQAKINVDYQLAERLQAEEQQELNDAEKATLFMQLLKKRSKFFAAKRAEEKRKKPPTRTQQRKESSKKAEADAIEISSKRAGTELEQESSKKQKLKDEKEIAELKQLLKIIPYKEEVAIDAIPLAVKPPSIVDWKIHKEGKRRYYKIIRADGSSNIYLVFSHMLKSFEREDLETLWKLVKAKHGSTRPEEDYERVLWGDLKVMFEPHIEDEVWKMQQRYNVVRWTLFNNYGVHYLSLQSGHIYMLVEKRYPLTPVTIIDMLNKKLHTNYFDEMTYQLLKLITK
nr:putative ribonuclease H-like domain-containing protein [Tanacetum cinerariifolium]